jgi:hypothetical protein
VLFDAGGDGEDVGVEDDVFGREGRLLGEQLVGTGADFGLAGIGVGLPGLVEGHHHDRCTVAARQPRLTQEFGLAFLHRDRVDDALALDALEAGLDDLPFRRVDHDRHPRDVRLAGDQLEEAIHRRFRIEHRLVHVDVDHLGAAFHLLACDRQRIVEAPFENHPREGPRTGDVGPLADIDEQGVAADVERLETGKAQLSLQLRNGARPDAGNALGDGGDMFGRGAAAAADDIDESLSRPVGDFGGQLLRRFVVTAKGVRQTGIRVRRDKAVAAAATVPRRTGAGRRHRARS